MGSFSIPHLIILLVIILIFFGRDRLPGLAKALGESVRGFKKGLEGEDDEDAKKQLAAKEKRELPGSSQGSGHSSGVPKKDEHKG